MSASKSTLPFRFVASDMDGTLLAPDHTMRPLTKATIEHLVRKMGVHFAVATGRPYPDVLITRRELKLTDCYAITSNGARVHDPEGNVIFSANIPSDVARTLACMEADNEEVASSLYQNEHWYMNKDASDLTEFYQSHRDLFYYELFDPKTHPSYEGVYKVYYTSQNRAHLEEMKKAIQERFGAAVHVTFSLPYCLECMPKHINKAVGVYRTLQHVFGEQADGGQADNSAEAKAAFEAGANPHDRFVWPKLHGCITFGDAANDVELMVNADKGCAMREMTSDLRGMVLANGQEGAFRPEFATLERIGSNAEDGVAKKLLAEFHLSEADVMQKN